MEGLVWLGVGVGGFALMMNVIWTVTELATIWTIRAPRYRTFQYLRLDELRKQTVISPAVGTVVSGLLVSVSASFFFRAVTTPEDEWSARIGLVVFLLSVIALALLLFAGAKGVGEPEEVARGPFAIRAAADEYASDPRRAPLDPRFLRERLRSWDKMRAFYSLNISVKDEKGDVRPHISKRLGDELATAAQARGVWSATRASLRVYRVAYRRFPTRLGGPIHNFVLYAFTMILFFSYRTVAQHAPLFVGAAAATMAIFLGAIVTMARCAARGNRARLWHKVYNVAAAEAHEAVTSAEAVQMDLETRETRLWTVITRLERFLERASELSATPQACRQETSIEVGSLRVTVTRRATE